MVNIDELSDIAIYSLSTVGVTWQLSVEQRGVVDQGANASGFASTMTCWTR
jgi:glucan 1,3-beta-glucosidase